jgi:hypothetical protein
MLGMSRASFTSARRHPGGEAIGAITQPFPVNTLGKYPTTMELWNDSKGLVRQRAIE